MKIKYKKLHPNAIAPKQGRVDDACWDLVCTSMVEREKYIEYKVGISIEVPEDHVALLFPRSSCSNYDQILSNCVGVVDPGYRGEIGFRYKTSKGGGMIYQVGERVGQMLIIQRPYLEFEEVEELSSSERGTGGYGSSGK
jgi:dUTP pyrophosphatase